MSVFSRSPCFSNALTTSPMPRFITSTFAPHSRARKDDCNAKNDEKYRSQTKLQPIVTQHVSIACLHVPKLVHVLL